MLFCKNLGETRSLRCGGISTTMGDKSTSSDAPTPTATEAPQAPSLARTLYPMARYRDPILEKPAAPVKKVDAVLGRRAEGMFASMSASQRTGTATSPAPSSL